MSGLLFCPREAGGNTSISADLGGTTGTTAETGFQALLVSLHRYVSGCRLIKPPADGSELPAASSPPEDDTPTASG
ncbi:hypothetical protein EYF80_056345 [Liparis tanakae]|uniref:Uncharacterized protein n=1 Tax=Liparis tanakae TaxID=230148 RepID=A0A4Z2EY41_9TELE|nr:hypothetical protein EYF80_056345 [Liparis tanakae]